MRLALKIWGQGWDGKIGGRGTFARLWRYLKRDWPSITLTPNDVGGDMPIYNILISLIIVGVILWAVNKYIPMDSKIKSILNFVVVILVLLWLLQFFTGYTGFPRIMIIR